MPILPIFPIFPDETMGGPMIDDTGTIFGGDLSTTALLTVLLVVV
jgi:hypothetical protein